MRIWRVVWFGLVCACACVREADLFVRCGIDCLGEHTLHGGRECGPGFLGLSVRVLELGVDDDMTRSSIMID